MAHVYILYSESLGKFYTGSCMNIKLRLEQHKTKFFQNSYTSFHDDWVLYLSMDDLSHIQARKIEAHIKKMKSKKYIQNLKKYPELRSKLIQRFLDYPAGSSR